MVMFVDYSGDAGGRRRCSMFVVSGIRQEKMDPAQSINQSGQSSVHKTSIRTVNLPIISIYQHHV